MSFLRFVSVVILAIWIGGLLVLGAVVAPTLFAALQAHDPGGGRALAADVFGVIFGKFLTASWLLGGFMIVSLAVRAALGPRPRLTGIRVLTVAAMLAISIGTSVILAPRIDRLRRETPGAIATLTDADPRKIEFNRLHAVSNGLILITLIAGLGLLWFETHDVH